MFRAVFTFTNCYSCEWNNDKKNVVIFGRFKCNSTKLLQIKISQVKRIINHFQINRIEGSANNQLEKKLLNPKVQFWMHQNSWGICFFIMFQNWVNPQELSTKNFHCTVKLCAINSSQKHTTNCFKLPPSTGLDW